nr:MAG TPA: hypothetical protein [Caudoviricetes sp.]
MIGFNRVRETSVHIMSGANPDQRYSTRCALIITSM